MNQKTGVVNRDRSTHDRRSCARSLGSADPSQRATYLELAVDLVAECPEQLLPVRVGVPAADRAALRGVAVGQDGDDQLLVRAPPCDRRTRETGQSISSRRRLFAAKCEQG
jgi:hypothetical protein